MKFTNHIAIIGCGIAGLTLACALRKFNIETVIFERNAELNEFGAGISLSKNVVKENSPAGAVIGSVVVEDPDTDDKYKFGIARDLSLIHI